MARTESKAIMGYLPIEERHYPALLSLVAPVTPTHRLLDPYAGEGAFLEAAARTWNMTPYANIALGMGYTHQGDWLSGPCLYPARHHHDDAHPSFGFNTRTGYGHCFRCGSILLKDVCAVLGIRGADYGGIIRPERV